MNQVNPDQNPRRTTFIFSVPVGGSARRVGGGPFKPGFGLSGRARRVLLEWGLRERRAQFHSKQGAHSRPPKAEHRRTPHATSAPRRAPSPPHFTACAIATTSRRTNPHRRRRKARADPARHRHHRRPEVPPRLGRRGVLSAIACFRQLDNSGCFRRDGGPFKPGFGLSGRAAPALHRMRDRYNFPRTKPSSPPP